MKARAGVPGAVGALVSVYFSGRFLLGAIHTATRTGDWGQLEFAGAATAAVLAGAWVYAGIWARRERQRLAGRR